MQFYVKPDAQYFPQLVGSLGRLTERQAEVAYYASYTILTMRGSVVITPELRRFIDNDPRILFASD